MGNAGYSYRKVFCPGCGQTVVEDLEVVALSHLHVDHSGDLPSLLKSGYFADRSRPLTLLGPQGNDGYRDLGTFIAALLASPKTGGCQTRRGN
jgi:ribonuclease BN (tRNA processing enzyme)